MDKYYKVTAYTKRNRRKYIIEAEDKAEAAYEAYNLFYEEFQPEDFEVINTTNPKVATDAEVEEFRNNNS